MLPAPMKAPLWEEALGNQKQQQCHHSWTLPCKNISSPCMRGTGSLEHRHTKGTTQNRHLLQSCIQGCPHGEGCVAPRQYYRKGELPNLGLTYIRKDYMEDPTQKDRKTQGKNMNSISCRNKLLYSTLPEEALLGCFQSPREKGFLRDFLQPELAAVSLSRDSGKDTSVEHKLDAWKSRCTGDENISTTWLRHKYGGLEWEQRKRDPGQRPVIG